MTSASSRTHIACISITVLLFVGCYHEVLGWMYERYVGPDSYYSHGFLIPVVSAFLIWLKRDEYRRENIQISWSGLCLIIGSCLIHISGTYMTSLVLPF